MSIFHFSHFGKNKEVQIKQHSEIPKSVCELGRTWMYSLRPTLKKSQFWIYGWIGQSQALLSFTVENKVGISHKAVHISDLT